MVGLSITEKPKYRPVIIKLNVEGDKRGLFHGWFNKIDSSSVRTSTHCVSLSGVESDLFGIIELPSGETVLLKAKDFKFNDSEHYFNDFYWSGNEKILKSE